MVQTIFKYSAPLREVFELDLPKGAKPLTVQMQAGQAHPQLWVELDSDAQALYRSARFQWVGTGRPVPCNGNYIGTVQTGAYVWHLYILD